MGLSPEVLMLVSAAVAAVIAVALGYTWDDIMNSIVGKLSKTMPAIFILIIVGFLIGSWMIGGTIPMMVYYGLKIISPRYIAVTSFLVTAVVSLCTGTSWGSAGTIGVALMGVAAGMGAPLPLGRAPWVPVRTLVTKCLRFPIPQTRSRCGGRKAGDHIGHMHNDSRLYYLPHRLYDSRLFSAGGGTVATPEKVETILATLDGMFKFNPLVILPPVIVLYGSIRKKHDSGYADFQCGSILQRYHIPGIFASAVLYGSHQRLQP
ncbi:MAG: hypothetical protein ACLUOI_31900 [Eisenbergiella sp.]